MNPAADIVAKIASNSTLNTLLAGRVYAGQSPMDAAWPYLVFTEIGRSPTYTHSGLGYYEVLIEIGVHSDSYAQVMEIRAELLECFECLETTNGQVWFEDDFSVLSDKDGANASRGIHRGVQTWSVIAK
jgi:hypothetical protein